MTRPGRTREGSGETLADRAVASHPRRVRRTPAAPPDPDETVDLPPEPPRLQGPRFLVFVAGAALVTQHLLTGVIATPFFGGEAFVWGNVLGAFLLSLGAGLGLGEGLVWLAGGSPRGPWRLAAAGGALVVAATWGFPWIARRVLDAGPESPWAPAITFALTLALPGAVLASVIPAVLPTAPARSALRRVALALLGGLAGLVLSSWGMRHADESLVWAQLYGLGGGLLLLSLAGLGNPGRALALAVGAALAGAIVQKPSEIQSHEFELALSEAFVLRGCGRYYASSAPEHVLDDTDVKRRLDQARRRLHGDDRKIAILLVVETIRSLGPINVSGEGLSRLLETYLPDSSKPLVLPFVRTIRSVRSDGRSMHFTIARSGQEGIAKFEVPGKAGEPPQTFAILSDFDLTVSTPDDRTTKLEIGPQTLEKAGLFEVNDTIKTPFLCKNVALWIDACLLAIVVENGQDRVIVKAVAQASVGTVQTKVLQAIDKAAVQ